MTAGGWARRAADTAPTGLRARRATTLAVVGTPAVGAAWLAVPAGPGRAGLTLLPNAFALLAVLVGVRHHRPAGGSAWRLLAITQLCSLGAFAYWYPLPSVTGVRG